MKHLKLYEGYKLSAEEKEGNKVARKIQHLVNKFTSIKDKNILEVRYNIFYETFKYSFDPYIFITIQNYKSSPKLLELIDELVRLNTEGTPEKHSTPFNERNKRIFNLTKQQIDELLISFKNGIPKKPITIKNINPEEIYTYIALNKAFHNTLMNDDIIIGKLLYLKNFNKAYEIKIKGLNMRNKEIEKNIYNNWIDHMNYVRIATEEEKDKYKMNIEANKYNL